MLEEGSENIGEIAQLVGFKRANLFCRVFREVTGIAPGQYRRKTRRDKNTFPVSNASI
jgi:AraC-like DNA-binding protein